MPEPNPLAVTLSNRVHITCAVFARTPGDLPGPPAMLCDWMSTALPFTSRRSFGVEYLLRALVGVGIGHFLRPHFQILLVARRNAHVAVGNPDSIDALAGICLLSTG